MAASASASLSPNRADATPDIVADALSRELPFGNRLVTLSVSGAVLTAAIGVAAARFGLSDALALAATSYVLCLVALLFLPETRGKSLGG